MGGSGLWLGTGSQDCVVTDSLFEDLSGAGVMIGGIGDPTQTDPAKKTVRNTVARNTIRNVSQEYHASAALVVGYAHSTTIQNNEIAHVSYSGISLSWGWGTASYAGNNHVVGNHVHHVMCGELLDGAHPFPC